MPNTARDAPRQAFGPTANGWATKPAHRARPPGPHSAQDAAELSRPSDLIRRPAATLAGSKPATPVFPETLATLSPSPFSLHATQRRPERPWRLGKQVAGAAVGPLAGARAPPVRERAAVEPAVDGATLSSPARATPASRSGEQAAPLCREVRRATAQARHTHRRRQWRVD